MKKTARIYVSSENPPGRNEEREVVCPSSFSSFLPGGFSLFPSIVRHDLNDSSSQISPKVPVCLDPEFVLAATADLPVNRAFSSASLHSEAVLLSESLAAGDGKWPEFHDIA
jgi:hypothetical protein